MKGKTNPRTSKLYTEDDIWAIAQSQYSELKKKKQEKESHMMHKKKKMMMDDEEDMEEEDEETDDEEEDMMKKKKRKMMKEELKYNAYSVELKEVQGEFFAVGYIATSHPDEVDDIISKECLESIAKQINTSITANGVSIHHNRADKDLIGIGKNAKVVNMPDGHYGVMVETHLNKKHPDFDKVKYEIENGFIRAYSIEYQPIRKKEVSLNGKKFRFLEDIALKGYGLASRPVNPNATLIQYGYKEMMDLAVDEKEELQNNVPDSTFETVDKRNDVAGVKEGYNNTEVSAMAQLNEEEYKEFLSFKEHKTTEDAKLKQKELVKEVLKEMEQKESKPLINPEPKFEAKSEMKEVKDYKESLKLDSSKSVNLDMQWKAAGKLVTALGNTLIERSRSAPSVEIKAMDGKLNFECKGNRFETKEMEYKAALLTSSNKVSDTDYYQNAAELSDVYAPIIYNTIAQQAVFYNLLRKVDAGSFADRYGFVIRHTANDTAGNYGEGAEVSSGSQGRLKCQIPFVFYKVGVEVSGQMISASRNGGIVGDIYSQEIKDATLDLVDLISSDLLTSTQDGFTAAGKVMGLPVLVDDGGTYANLYGHARASVGNGKLQGTDASASSARVTKSLLRQMIRVVEKNGARRSDLIFVCDHLQKDFILSLLDDQQRLNSNAAVGGFSGLPSFDDIPIWSDKDCSDSIIFLIDMANTFLAVQVPPTYEELAKTKDARNGFIKTYLQLVCTAPNHNYQLNTLATT